MKFRFGFRSSVPNDQDWHKEEFLKGQKAAREGKPRQSPWDGGRAETWWLEGYDSADLTL